MKNTVAFLFRALVIAAAGSAAIIWGAPLVRLPSLPGPILEIDQFIQSHQLARDLTATLQELLLPEAPAQAAAPASQAETGKR